MYFLNCLTSNYLFDDLGPLRTALLELAPTLAFRVRRAEAVRVDQLVVRRTVARALARLARVVADDSRPAFAVAVALRKRPVVSEARLAQQVVEDRVRHVDLSREPKLLMPSSSEKKDLQTPMFSGVKEPGPPL